MIKSILLASLLIAFVLSSASAEDKEKKENNYGTVIGIDLGTTYSW